ncbi:Aste57867_11506 [Aphanomyces stellatus]|uniref:Aste57867_11506 protein n=1 Tax=Aphanomyces stellatus TaxID=120398 RepID=A0A485KTP6_9STRA|nr:hypothetical protein As57867_011463 [Aphanomyces stellatus]VFT88367.1 Aste57867_11506 [Aphanomyces stellatus]
MNEVLGLFTLGCELSTLRQEKEALRCFLAIRMPTKTASLSGGQVEIVDMYIAELYLKLAMEGQHKGLSTYRLPDASRIVQRVPLQHKGSSSLPFPRHEWSVRRLRCEWMLKVISDPHAYRALVDILCQGIQLCEQSHELSHWLTWYRSTLQHQLKEAHAACASNAPAGSAMQFRDCAMAAYDTLAPSTSDASFKLWLLNVLCHSILELPTISVDESAKTFSFCQQYAQSVHTADAPPLRVYFAILHILLLFRKGDVVVAGPLVQDLSVAIAGSDNTLPSSWRHLPAVLQLQIDAYYDPNIALSKSAALLSSLHSEPRDAAPFLWFDAQHTVCHLLEAQGRYSELGLLAQDLALVVEMPHVAQTRRAASMQSAVHILLAKYCHALNHMDDAINHVNAAFALILADTPMWPELSDANMLHMMGLLDVATAISCFPLPASFTPQANHAILQPYFPADNLLEFAAGVLRDTNLRQRIYGGPSKEVRAKYDLYLCKWLWGTQCLGLVGTYPDMDGLRSYMLSVLQDCLELSSASINCSNITAEIMVLFGPKLIEFGRIDEGERTLTNALKIAMHTKNLKLQIQIMMEVHASCGRKDQLKSQAVVAEKYLKKLESLSRKVARAVENRALHTRLLSWQVQDS